MLVIKGGGKYGKRGGGRHLQLLFVYAAFIERDEWAYVSTESVLEATRLMSSGENLVDIEEDELGGSDVIVRLPDKI